MSIESPRPSVNTNVKQVGLPWRPAQDVPSVGPSLVVEGLPNNAMEPSARELTLARLGSSLTLPVHPAEISKEWVETLGFSPAGGHLLYAARARSA